MAHHLTAAHTGNTRTSAAAHGGPGIFQPADYFLLRTPRLPMEVYLSLTAPDEASPDAEAGLGGDAARTGPSGDTDDQIRAALAIGSPDLLEEVDRAPTNQRERQRTARKLLRYSIRMATRPTPFGLFAGVAAGQWGDTTTLALAQTAAYLQVRPDMGWLMPLVWRLEALPEIRRSLRWVANTATFERGGRLYLVDTVASGHRDAARVPSVRATSAVRLALAAARVPTPYHALCALLLERIPGATPQKVEQLLDDLWRQSLMLTTLRPAVTGTSAPAWEVQRYLAEIPAAREVADLLEEVLSAVRTWEATLESAGLNSYRELLARLREFEQAVTVLEDRARNARDDRNGDQTREELPAPLAGEALDGNFANRVSGRFLQVDSSHRLAGTCLSAQIRSEIGRMAELTYRLSPYPSGLGRLDAFREAFMQRYGTDREVALLEALSPQFGLGDFAVLADKKGESARAALSPAHNQALMELAVGALRDRRVVVELDNGWLARLETSKPVHARQPTSMDLSVFVAAASVAALDAGEFQLILGPNGGSVQAGRYCGRFAALLGSTFTDQLSATAREEEALDPLAIWAEVVYLPYTSRPVNVSLRPALRRYEVAVACTPGVTPEATVPVDELVIGLREGRFYVRWPGHDAEVIACAGHMLNSMAAPAVVRLLEAIAADRVTLVGMPFNWGDARTLPVLPRVQAGRLVLAPARWRLTRYTRESELSTTSADAFQAGLSRWRERWQVPRHVYMTTLDNRLLLDLDSSAPSEELRAELEALQHDGSVTLEEALPGPADAWLPGPGGRYVVELNVPLVRRPAPVVPREESTAHGAAGEVGTAAHEGRALALAVPSNVRLRPPGSEWLFMKVYASEAFHEELLAGPISALTREVLQNSLAADWFFIRYSDPEPHLRLRFRGDSQVLRERLLPLLCEWGSALMENSPVLTYQFDVYDREIERYGGLQGIVAAEAIFGIDSRLAVEVLALKHGAILGLDEMLLVTLTANELLGALGASPEQRRSWCRARGVNRRTSGALYRAESKHLRALLAQPEETLAGSAGGRELWALLTPWSGELALQGEKLQQLAAEGRLLQPPAALYSSIVHMHCNRLFGIERAAEEQVIGLLGRTLDGLQLAPAPVLVPEAVPPVEARQT